MAKILLGANITSMTGKLGGTVFQGIGKGQTIMRRKVSPNRHTRFNGTRRFLPNYATVQRVKQQMSWMSRLWGELTHDERESWLNNEYLGRTGFGLFRMFNPMEFQETLNHRSWPGQPLPLPVIEGVTVLKSDNPQSVYTISGTYTNAEYNPLIKVYYSNVMSKGRKTPVNGWRYFTETTATGGVFGFNFQNSQFNIPAGANVVFAYRVCSNYRFPATDFIPVREQWI